MADIIIFNGKITTLDESHPEVEALAIQDGIIKELGTNEEIGKLANTNTVKIDAGKRRVIPGLNDSHLHLIRGGLNYNMELRWDGVPLKLFTGLKNTQSLMKINHFL